LYLFDFIKSTCLEFFTVAQHFRKTIFGAVEALEHQKDYYHAYPEYKNAHPAGRLPGKNA
jgi:hypothetical protein